MVERPASPEYYPSYYLPTISRADKLRLYEKDLVELRAWYNSLNTPFDAILDLHDNTPHPLEREYADRVARQLKVGFVTADGRLACDKSRKRFLRIDYCHITGEKMTDEVMSRFRPKPSLPIKVERNCLDTLGIEDFEIRFEFLPVLFTTEGRVKKFSVGDGARTIIQLIQYLRDNLY